jgi:hypothetical protein
VRPETVTGDAATGANGKSSGGGGGGSQYTLNDAAAAPPAATNETTTSPDGNCVAATAVGGKGSAARGVATDAENGAEAALEPRGLRAVTVNVTATVFFFFFVDTEL